MKPLGPPPSHPASVVASAPPQRSRLRRVAYAAGLLLAGGALATAWRPASPQTPLLTPPVAAVPVAVATDAPLIEIGFVVDTTGSMGGLISAAKKKIWTICNELADAQPRPRIRLGLVAYRDHGDAYLTRTVDLTGDLDAFYSQLAELKAGGGGDAPEAVDEGLAKATHALSWDRTASAKILFLVGDAPPHAKQWASCLVQAATLQSVHGIVLNTVQCGEATETQARWQELAQAGGGRYLQIDQQATVHTVSTPLDASIVSAQREIEDTCLFFGSDVQQKRSRRQWSRNGSLSSEAYVNRSSTLNKTRGGYRQDLLKNLANGAVRLTDLREDQLPPVLRALTPCDRQAYVNALRTKRARAEAKLAALVGKRDAYLRGRVAEDASFDRQLLRTLKSQSAAANLSFDSK